MSELTEEEKKENLRNLVSQMEKEGKVVLTTIQGYVSMDLDHMINDQPLEGLLYDLNRLPETIWTFIDDPKWVNDYAVYLVIKRLKEIIDAQSSIPQEGE